MLFCIQDFSGIVNASYNNNFAEYLVQVVGENGAVGLLVLLFIDSTCVAAANIMSCQVRSMLLPYFVSILRLAGGLLVVN